MLERLARAPRPNKQVRLQPSENTNVSPKPTDPPSNQPSPFAAFGTKLVPMKEQCKRIAAERKGPEMAGKGFRTGAPAQPEIEKEDDRPIDAAMQQLNFDESDSSDWDSDDDRQIVNLVHESCQTGVEL